MNEGGFPSNLPILDGKNWEKWSASMRLLLGAQEVFEIVQDGYEQLGANPTEKQQTTFKDCKKRDCKTITNQMKANGEVMIEVVMIEKILRILTQRYDHIVVAIEESKNLDTMKLEDLQSYLEAHELRVKERDKDQDEEVGGSRSQQNSDNKSKKPSGKNKFDKRRVQCYNCQKYGHFADECRSKKVRRDNGEAQLAQEDSSDLYEVLLMPSTSMEDDCPGLWYLDTWCSNHMNGHKDWFVSIDEKVKREIRFVDNSIVTAEGVGKILIQRMDGK
ncbi:uncharacterized protein [Cicer arietinum]|uniref:uncharacterized protein n=1 Tax=Cicer arietinum TaxID=3827 RepID=UPI003CC5CB01